MNVNVSACSCPCACPWVSEATPWVSEATTANTDTITTEELRDILRRQNQFLTQQTWKWIDLVVSFLLVIMFWELISAVVVLLQCIAPFLYKHRGVIYIWGLRVGMILFWVQVFREYHTLLESLWVEI